MPHESYLHIFIKPEDQTYINEDYREVFHTREFDDLDLKPKLGQHKCIKMYFLNILSSHKSD